jgi:hypothetical protein
MCVCMCVCVCERERERERDGNRLWELQNLIPHSASLESLNSKTVHLRTGVDVNHFYFLYIRNSLLK